MDIENQDKSAPALPHDDEEEETGRTGCLPNLFAGNSPVPSSPPQRRGGIPLLEQILLDVGERNPQPWRPRTLLEFLTSEHNEENFYFFEEVEGLKAARGLRPQAPPQELCVIPVTAKDSEEKYLASILDTFVKEGAQLQINISHEQRRSVLSLDAKAIEEAQEEVKQLILRDAFPRFVRRVTSENITQSFSDKRKIFGITMLLLTALAVGLMLGFHVTRYYLFLTWFGWFAGVEEITVSKTKLCPICVARSVAQLNGEQEVVIACPIARGMIRRRAMGYLSLSLALATLLTVGSFVLTYIIEAANGGANIYG